METNELVKKCILRDADAQKELYSIYAPQMLSVCNRYAKSYHDARDIFQEGFFKVFENIKQLKDINSLEWWMRKIFVNEALNLYKKKKRLTLLENYNHLQIIHDSFSIHDKIGTEEITKQIQQLPDKMRMVFNMYVIEGFSHQEIAKSMNISVGTSKSNLHDARKTIQGKLRLLEQERLFG